MIRLLFKKAYRDLITNKARTLLVLIAMVIGLTGVGAVFNARAILSREINVNYMRTNPASATIWVEGIEDETIIEIEAMPQIASVEMRKTLVGSIQKEDKVGTEVHIFVVQDFNNLKNSIFYKEKGAFPPNQDEILIERVALSMTDAQIGDKVTVRLPGLIEKEFKIAGTAYDPGLPPAWMEGMAFGFISLDTYAAIYGDKTLNEIKIVVADDQMNKEHIQNVTDGVVQYLEDKGYTVNRINIPQPGNHPHASQMDTLLFLLASFGILTFILSAIIVANMISALLSQQIRQIGTMKAVGGRTNQIGSIYLTYVLILGLAAAVISMPLAKLAGTLYASFAADMLNFTIFSASVPHHIYMIQIALAIGLPILSSAFTILKGSRVTVREALQDYGVTASKNKRESESFISRLGLFSSPFLMSLRNTTRKKGRLIFTLVVLSIGGSLFISSLNVFSAMNTSAAGFIKSFKEDVRIGLSHAYPADSLKQDVLTIPNVQEVEIWATQKIAPIGDDAKKGNSFTALFIPTDTNMVEPIQPEIGRWLRPDDNNTIVLNHLVLKNYPEIKVGDRIQLEIDGRAITFNIVGIVNEIMSEPKAYINQEWLIKQNINYSQVIVIKTLQHDVKSLNKIVPGIQHELETKGYDVVITKIMQDMVDAVQNHLLLLASMLIIMSLLSFLVGGLGLSTTMSINILERTRELGVLRAIGASSKQLYRIIIGEGAIIGAFSWVIATLIAIPFSFYISRTFGTIFFETPLTPVISPLGIALWLVLSIVLASIASLFPAKAASKASIRECLVYE